MPKEEKNIETVHAEIITDNKHVELDMELGKLSFDGIQLAMLSNNEHMGYAVQLKDMEAIERCRQIEAAYQGMLGMFNANNVQVLMEQSHPEIKALLNFSKFGELVSPTGLALSMGQAQEMSANMKELGVSIEEMRNMKHTWKDGNLIYNEDKLKFYRNVTLTSKIRLDNVIKGMLETGNRENAIEEVINMFKCEPEYWKVIRDIDIFAMRKKALEQVKVSFDSKKEHKKSWFAFKELEPDLAEEKGKADANYWGSLTPEQQSKVRMKFVAEKVEKFDNEEFLLTIIADLPEEENKGNFQVKTLGRTRLDILVESMLVGEAHNYLEYVKSLTPIYELSSKASKVVIDICPRGSNVKVGEMELLIAPAKVIFSSKDKDGSIKKSKPGYVVYDSLDTMERGVIRYVQFMIHERMGVIKGLNTLGDLLANDKKEDIVKEITRLVATSMGVKILEVNFITDLTKLRQ